MRLEDDAIVLRPLEEADAPALAAAIGDDPDLDRWTRMPFPYTEDDARAFIAGTEETAFAVLARGGGAERVTLDGGLVTSREQALDVVALDLALEAFSAVDVRKSRIIELRFFGGLSVEETAEVLHVSPDTVKRDWRLAKLWLLRELEGEAR